MIFYTYKKKPAGMSETEYLIFADDTWFATVGNSWDAGLLIRAMELIQQKGHPEITTDIAPPKPFGTCPETFWKCHQCLFECTASRKINFKPERCFYKERGSDKKAQWVQVEPLR